MSNGRFLFLVVLLSTAGGCGAGHSGLKTDSSGRWILPPSSYAVEHCKLDVVLEPASHRLEATVALHIARRPDALEAAPGILYVELHRDLSLDTLVCAGKPVPFRRLPDAAPPADKDEEECEFEGALPPAVYKVGWSPGVGAAGAPLVFRYSGRLYQDVEAGEKPGEIHNFLMKAHVGEEGIYLGEGGAWYPRIAESDDAETEPEREAALAQYELTATEIPGMVLVACGNREGAKLDVPRGERTTWRSPFPFHGIALVGGRHQVFQRQVGEALVSVHVSEDHASFAPGILDAVESYLDLYEPLIGELPYDEFTVVENFFSSGFAFPGFTVLASAVIGMGEMGLRPGYLDHEMLHNWWGNGVFVSALDGNWCECITSYCANYMRHVLEDRPDKARSQRRNICYGLSRITPEKDKPLGDFGEEEGPSRFVGYQKGSMVYAMLARKVGEDTLWRAFRKLSTERLGKPTGWKHIREAVEKESGQSLEAFFDVWVRGVGVPDIRIDSAHYDPQARRLTLAVLQEGDSVFDVTVPVRLLYEDSVVDETIVVNRSAQVALIPSLTAPRFVELDPDFHVMRRVPKEDLMPTISSIGKLRDLVIVRSEADGDAYDAVAGRIEDRYKKSEDTAVRQVKASELTDGEFGQGHALLLGKACLAPAAQAVLEGSPLTIGDGFFSVGDQRYSDSDHEVLCCVRSGQDPGGVFAVYYGNDATQLKKTGVLTFYGGNSLVVFKDGRVVERRDFERTQRVAVEVGS